MYDVTRVRLAAQVGDKIKVVSRVNAEWVTGELRGAKGIFPADFVDRLPEGLPEASKEETSSGGTKTKVWISNSLSQLNIFGYVGPLYSWNISRGKVGCGF